MSGKNSCAVRRTTEHENRRLWLQVFYFQQGFRLFSWQRVNQAILRSLTAKSSFCNFIAKGKPVDRVCRRVS